MAVSAHEVGVAVDVLVVGGGAAGIAAAAGAADAGGRVALIERHDFLGGMATAAMVGTICGLYLRANGAITYAVGGFARTFAEALAERGGTSPCSFKQGLCFLPYAPTAFAACADSALAVRGVEVLHQASPLAVQTERGQVTAVRAWVADRVLRFDCGTVVDASGDAVVSVLAGISAPQDEQPQGGALVCRVGGLAGMDPQTLGIGLLRAISRGIDAGDLDLDSRRLSVIPGTLDEGSALLKLGLPAPSGDDYGLRSRYTRTARSRLSRIITYVRTSDRDFASLRLLEMAPQIGIRSGRRGRGVACLEDADVLACRKTDDGVAIGAWPIEFWSDALRPTMRYFAEGDYYTLPVGALRSGDLGNLYFAGRGLSAEAGALASARVIGTCLGSGYAAGVLAAASAAGRDQSDTVQALRRSQFPQS